MTVYVLLLGCGPVVTEFLGFYINYLVQSDFNQNL